MSANSSSQSLSVKTRRAGKQKVVRGILRGLMEGSWKGNDRITEVSAVESFGVSRTHPFAKLYWNCRDSV